MTLSGGKRGLLIDAFYSAGLNFAPLSKNATDKLAKMLGPGSIVGNPLDAGFAAVVDPSVYMQSIKIMIDDPDTDIVIIDAELPKAPHELRERNLRIVNEMAGDGGKPVIYISAMSIGFTEFTKDLRKSLPNIAVMQGLDRAVGAIKSLIDYASLRKEVPDIDSSSKASARAVLEKALKAANGAALDEVASKKLLKAYGIPVSKEEIAQTAAEAVKIAKKIGFPVVAKVVSAEILHKSDIGGVVLNLNSAAEVKKAFNDITARVKKLKNKPKLEGILIAQQVKADLELVVGASLDAEMGPVVLFGTGGVDIELMKDVALAGAPLDADEAKAADRPHQGRREDEGLSRQARAARGFRREGAGRPVQPDGGCRQPHRLDRRQSVPDQHQGRCRRRCADRAEQRGRPKKRRRPLAVAG